MTVDILLLGHVRARVEGRLVELGPAQQRSVLAVLAVTPDEPVSADQLVHRVWGDRVPTRAKETLRTYLTRLRKVFGDSVEIGRHAGGYVLGLDPDSVDLHRFRRLVGEARAGSTRTACSAMRWACGGASRCPTWTPLGRRNSGPPWTVSALPPSWTTRTSRCAAAGTPNCYPSSPLVPPATRWTNASPPT